MLIIYLFNRLIFRVKEFFRHWYINSFFIWSDFTVSFLEKLDRFFAIRITWRYLFHPLYQDRNALGYILGFIFRTQRILAGIFVYFIIIAAMAGLYLIWLAFPAYVIYRAFFNI